MPRLKKPPRLYRRGDTGVWVIRDGPKMISTGDRDQSLARIKLSQYLASRHTGKTLPNLRAALKRAWGGAMQRSKERGELCDLMLSDVEDLYILQGGCCAVTGVPFRLENVTEQRRNPYGVSVDRINNQIGYTRANVRLVLVFANIAMADFGAQVFHDIIAEIISRTGGNCAPAQIDDDEPQRKMA